MARYVGLPARGWGINAHSVPEIFYDNQWHMLDASMCNYFLRPDGQIAGVAEICEAVQSWLKDHPGLKGNPEKLTEFQRADGWTGWKRGPVLIAGSPLLAADGWWPARTHGWYSTMQEFDGSGGTPFPFEYGYSQGYEVNLQLRRGERITRHWFNRGLHVNGVGQDGDDPGCLKIKVGQESMAFLPAWGDLNEGRIGSGTHEYELPFTEMDFPQAILLADNTVCRGREVVLRDPARPGAFELLMACSYVYLNGYAVLDTTLGNGGQVRLWFSDNHGLDWKPVAAFTQSGKHRLDLRQFALRRYGYRLRVELTGAGTRLHRLNLRHEFQCSQRALPTLGQGENTIRFSAGAREGTVTIEGTPRAEPSVKQVSLQDFHPVLQNVEPQNYVVKADGASVTFPVSTPGEMTRLRLGGHYRVRDARDRWDLQVSFDDGNSFRTVDSQAGPYQGICKYVTVSDLPPGTRSAKVRWVGTQRNTTCIFFARIDADYRQPFGGFSPIRVTYVWEEDGQERKDVHVARSPEEAYTIRCASKPRMKSIALEWAE
jgi:hypothetical protein